MVMNNDFWPSVSATAAPLVANLIADAEKLRITVEKSESGATLVDAGIDCPGGVEAGIRIAEICMAGLGRVALVPDDSFGRWSWSLSVHSSNPVLACLGSQYAGWSLKHEEGGKTFTALASGPGRAVVAREDLFDDIGYRDKADNTCFVLEVNRRPPEGLIQKIADDCGIAPKKLTLVLTPTSSLAGTVQVVARVLEVALHKVRTVGFPLDRIVDGMGRAPLPPPSPDFITAIGRTNDAILFAGTVQLYITGHDDDAQDLANKLPSSSSRDYGKPFAEIFNSYNGDFFAVDPMLFSPSQVVVVAIDSGNSFWAGEHDEALLEASFAR